jgi:cytochrome c-type biogenesis protein CcmH/NrfF
MRPSPAPPRRRAPRGSGRALAIAAAVLALVLSLANALFDGTSPSALRPTLLSALLDHAAPPAHAQSAQTSLTDRGQIYTFRQVSEALVCQCGCNMILYVCNHVNCPSAYPFRDSIEAMILRGNTKDEIIARFVADEGEVVLSAPTTEGFNLAAWVTPFVMLVLGGVFLGSFLRARQQRAAAEAARAGARHDALSRGTSLASPGSSPADAYAARVDEELGGFRH